MTAKKCFSIAILFCLVALSAAAQQPADKSKRPSPPGTAEWTVNGKKVSIAYSRPSMKGRKIVGELVPYGQVWRTGANEATTLTTEADLDIGGTKVPAGTYTLFTLPGEDAWQLIINKQTGQWGTEYNQGQDLARVKMTTSKTSAPVEQFTISFSPSPGGGASLNMEWENTRVSVSVKGQ